MKMLPRSFFDRETPVVARALLGTWLVRRLPTGDSERPTVLIGRIVETEAYLGPQDGASHARSGKTARTTIMFGPLGRAYVYFTYGMHWMLNVVARRNQPAGAVLLRAVEPVQGLESMRAHRNGRADKELTNGPAKLCQALDVTGDLNGTDLCDPAGPLVLSAGPPLPPEQVATGPRIGIDYAPETWRTRSLRYWIRENRYVSR